MVRQIEDTWKNMRADKTAQSTVRGMRRARHGWSHDTRNLGLNGSRGGAPFAGLEQVAEHAHVQDLAGHQLAQESNLAQALWLL